MQLPQVGTARNPDERNYAPGLQQQCTNQVQYPDRIEIINHGGLYGKARPENFPTVNDYRNPAVAEGMQILGYVNMLNHGIPEVQRELEENGNGKAVFTIDRITVFEAKLMESGKGRSTVDTENLPVNLPVELAQVRKKSTFFI